MSYILLSKLRSTQGKQR